MIPYMEFLHFCLRAINTFAWLIVALGYPLFASNRAIESDSSHHMKKLVMYWAMAALLSLFEFAFENSFDWMPQYWSSVRYVVVYWLVIPEFEGASLAYERLVTPAVLAKLQEVVDLYNKIKEKDRVSKRERFSDAVEKFIKENGFKALEKLIATKKHHETQKCVDLIRDTKNVEPEGESTTAESYQTQNEHRASSNPLRDVNKEESEEKNSSSASQQVNGTRRKSSKSENVEAGTMVSVWNEGTSNGCFE